MQMKKGIYCKSLQNQYKTDLLYFFEIIQRMEPKALVQVILKLCLSLERESRHYEEHYKTLIFLHYVKI
jgi:hypothetical protein